MIKSKIILLVLCSLILLAMPGLAFQNEPDGFRGLKWGGAPTEDMVYVFTEEGERIYKRLDDRMYIGNAQFVSILYSFYSEPERFCKVALYFKEEETFD